MEANEASFRECIKKLNVYTATYDWHCDIHSWLQKKSHAQMWVIVLSKGPVVIRACGNSLHHAADRMLTLLAVTEKMSLAVTE